MRDKRDERDERDKREERQEMRGEPMCIAAISMRCRPNFGLTQVDDTPPQTCRSRSHCRNSKSEEQSLVKVNSLSLGLARDFWVA